MKRSRTERLLLQVLARLKRLEAHAPSATLSIREAAELAGVPDAAVKRWIRDGVIRADKDYFVVQELLLYLRGRRSRRRRSPEDLESRAKLLARGG